MPPTGQSPQDPSVKLHAAGQHHEALEARDSLLEQTPRTSPVFPGYLAASALSLERTGEYSAAVSRANEALSLARPMAEDDDEAAALRAQELPSVRINAGVVLFRDAARRRMESPYSAVASSRHSHADDLLSLAYDGIAAQRRSRIRPHQHIINLLPRMAMKEAVNGDTRAAVKFALGAIAVAPLSETKGLVEHTSGLGFKGQAMAKAKSLVRGFNALGIALTTLPGVRRSPKAAQWRDKRILRPGAGA